MPQDFRPRPVKGRTSAHGRRYRLGRRRVRGAIVQPEIFVQQ